jgi:rubredoxin
MKKFVCTVCGYEHEAESLPEDFVCPLCGVGAELFEEKEEE